ncbi:hypothetical protein [Herbaspirillum seropedicae]|uniref:hypothetical protein n=1 Tax=Herbaspirillum seropedicae TaxID=964 RepID=UPI00285699C8|nr:hypothetical protein [Herbaspirillum seropedicae]MDR6394656.1 hypothetical protein [Herbaspirillum seropedicae]
MKYVFAFFAIAVALAGCATSPVPMTEARDVPPERVDKSLPQAASPFGTITVVRDSGFLGQGCYFGLYIDGELVARLANSERHTVTLPAGEHILGTAAVGRVLCAREDERRETATIIKPGEHKIYRISARPSGEISIDPTTMLGPK